MAGYSGTSLSKKLGIKEHFRMCVNNEPKEYLELLTPLPSNVIITTKASVDLNIWHFFTKSSEELRKRLPEMMRQIRKDGMIWVSWPKKSSKVKTDVTEDVIRSIALPLGLVDVKVCAIDDIWSGLKLVIRKEKRNDF
ncbi:MAG: DUF3052 family protein [Acidobacteria bacterium]|nr:DUF3052 family protein [Acidobacteriota bacterium]